MAGKAIGDAITDSGIRWPYFFNGRLLSAEDMSEDQDAARLRIQAVGAAVGEGVAWGLEITSPVSGSSPSVHVGPGMAVNRLGQTLALSEGFDLALFPEPSDTANASATFNDCQGTQSAVFLGSAGQYLLTISSISQKDGRATVSGLGGETSPCNSKDVVEGVQFRLLRFSPDPSDLSDPKRMRNLVAYRCFGIAQVTTNPFQPAPTDYGIVDSLRASRKVTECDVPLAIFTWTNNQQIQDLDMWAVRRPVAAPSCAGVWAPFVSARRRSEAVAMLLQFQDHLKSVDRTKPAATAFRYLPPAGYLPGDLDWKAFLGASSNGSAIQSDEGLLRGIVTGSLDLGPIDLDVRPRTPVEIYRPVPSRPYVVFARSRRGRLQASFEKLKFESIELELAANAQRSNLSTRMTSVGSPFPFSADLEPGAYTVAVMSARYEAESVIFREEEMKPDEPLTVAAGATTNVSIRLRQRRLGSLSIRLSKTDFERFAKAKRRVSATLEDEAGGSRTDEFTTATLVFGDLPPGKYDISLQVDGAEFYTHRSTVQAELKTTIDVPQGSFK